MAKEKEEPEEKVTPNQLKVQLDETRGELKETRALLAKMAKKLGVSEDDEDEETEEEDDGW